MTKNTYMISLCGNFVSIL